MGLLLSPDVHCAQTADGTFLLTPRGKLAFDGATAAPLLDRLTPYLDGTHSLSELVADLPPSAASVIERLVTDLQHRGVVEDVTDGQTLRTQDLTGVVIGSGDLLVATLRVAIDAGFKAISAVQVGVDDLAQQAPESLEGLRVQPLRACDMTSERLGPLVDGADLVLHVGGRLDMARLLDEWCAAREVRLTQAIQVGDGIWIGPPGLVPSAAVSWTGGWWRITTGPRRPSPTVGYVDATRSPSAASAAVGAHRLVHHSVRAAIGLERPAEHRMTRLDTTTLRTSHHRFLPHPLSSSLNQTPTPDALLATIGRLAAAPVLGEDEFARRAASCVGGRGAILGEPDERDFAQIPVHVCEVEVADPVGLSFGAEGRSVIGCGPDLRAARHQALVEALARYASLCLDPRRLVDGRGEVVCTASASPEAVLADLRRHERPAFLYGLDLLDGGVRPVDVRDVFPVGRGAESAQVSRAFGGMSWRDAVTSALVDQCRQLVMADMATPAYPADDLHLALDLALDLAPDPDLGAVATDRPAAYYRSILRAGDEPTVFHDLSPLLGIPTLLCCVGGAPVGLGCGLSRSAAARGSMEEALLRQQSIRHRQASYLPPPLPPLAERAAAASGRTHDLDTDGCGDHADGGLLDITDLATAIATRGQRPVVVPLDHDLEVHAVLPHVVTVVLTSE